MKLCGRYVKGYPSPRVLFSKHHKCEICGVKAKYVVKDTSTNQELIKEIG